MKAAIAVVFPVPGGPLTMVMGLLKSSMSVTAAC